MEAMMLAERNNRDDAGHHVEQERSKVAGQRDNKQALRDGGTGIVRPDAEAIPKILRETLDGVTGERCSTTEVGNYSENPDYRRDARKRPNSPVRSQVLGMEHAQITSELVIATHRISDAGPSVDTGQRRSNERQKHGDGLDKHEPPSGLGTSENPGPDNLHHIPNRGRRRGRSYRRVAAIEEVVGSEIFEQVTERALNHE